ncbi:MAG: hypothetical protein NUV65_03045 [Candidatus Roizmanbacteria bacterium]|nr:hypothetical protein [Candidatus Roizmanbacteria bacterium]
MHYQSSIERHKKMAADFVELLKKNAPSLYRDYCKRNNTVDNSQIGIEESIVLSPIEMSQKKGLAK